MLLHKGRERSSSSSRVCYIFHNCWDLCVFGWNCMQYFMFVVKYIQFIFRFILTCRGFTTVQNSKKLSNHIDQWFKYRIPFYWCISRGINNLRFDKDNLNKKHLYQNDSIKKSLKSQWRQIGHMVMVLTPTHSYNLSHFNYESFDIIY